MNMEQVKKWKTTYWLYVLFRRLLFFWEYSIGSYLIPGSMTRWSTVESINSLLNFIRQSPFLRSCTHVSACIAPNKMVLSYLPLGSHAKQARRMIPYYRLSSNLVIQVSFRETIAAKEKPSSLSFSVPFLIFEIIHFCRLFLIEQYHRWNERSESFYDRRSSFIRIYLPLCHFLREELRWWRKPHVKATHADHQLIHKSLYKSLIFNRR